MNKVVNAVLMNDGMIMLFTVDAEDNLMADDGGARARDIKIYNPLHILMQPTPQGLAVMPIPKVSVDMKSDKPLWLKSTGYSMVLNPAVMDDSIINNYLKMTSVIETIGEKRIIS